MLRTDDPAVALVDRSTHADAPFASVTGVPLNGFEVAVGFCGQTALSPGLCVAQFSLAGLLPSALTRNRTGPVNDKRCPASRK